MQKIHLFVNSLLFNCPPSYLIIYSHPVPTRPVQGNFIAVIWLAHEPIEKKSLAVPGSTDSLRSWDNTPLKII